MDDASEMRLGGFLGQMQVCGNPLVGIARCHQAQNLDFPQREYSVCQMICQLVGNLGLYEAATLVNSADLLHQIGPDNAFEDVRPRPRRERAFGE
jgi:hypothetical protein